jgi:uncharacterized membrane protein
MSSNREHFSVKHITLILTMLCKSASDHTAPFARSSFMSFTCCSALAQCKAVKPRLSGTFTREEDADVSK